MFGICVGGNKSLFVFNVGGSICRVNDAKTKESVQQFMGQTGVIAFLTDANEMIGGDIDEAESIPAQIFACGLQISINPILNVQAIESAYIKGLTLYNADYGKQVAFSGPLYASMETKGNTVAISFNYAENGLKSAEGGLQNFQVAGEDKKFVRAKAIIDGNKVIVQSPLVMKPVAVRYLWDNASEASLFNTEDLPASSFRTDIW